MTTVTRFQVKAAQRAWDDPGPDLLRPKDNAHQALAGIMGHTGTKTWRWRRDKLDGTFTEWTRLMGKIQVLDAFDRWKAGDGKVFQIGKGKTKVLVRAMARTEVVNIADRGVDPGANLLSALMHHRFPGLNFCGGALCKTISGYPYDWSDHSWRDAIDECQDLAQGVKNDDVTDWTVRMARARCVTFDYLLGSSNGRVVKATAPDYEIEASSASSTHLWHNHISIIDHGGARPPWC